MTPTICTYTGIEFDLLNPRPEMVRIDDIAHALSNQSRFAGHTKIFYSVAQHCCLGCQLLEGRLVKQFLLHDATEAYLCDIYIPTPLKMILPDYKNYERKIAEVISKALRVDIVNLPLDIKFL